MTSSTYVLISTTGGINGTLDPANRSGTIGHFVARLDGAAFVPVGPQVATGNRDVRGALAFDPQGRPVVAVQRASPNELRVLRFESGAWVTLGGAVASGSFIDEPSLVFDDGGAPVVGWRDNLAASLRRFDTATADWAAPGIINGNVGVLGELRRRLEGGRAIDRLLFDAGAQFVCSRGGQR